MKARIYHNVLTNPEEVNLKDSWEVAKFEKTLIAESINFSVEVGFDGKLNMELILDRLFLESNHIAGDWTLNNKWKTIFEQNPRSTTVGDWISLDGELYEVAFIGFKKVA